MKIVEYRLNSVIGTMHLGEGYVVRKSGYRSGVKDEITKKSYTSEYEIDALMYLKRSNYFTSENRVLNRLQELLHDIVKEYRTHFFQIKFFVYQKNDYILVTRDNEKKTDFREESYIRINLINGSNFDYQDILFSDDIERIREEIISFIEEYILKQKLKSIYLKDEMVNLICMPGTGGHLIHELLGHILEADFVKKKINFLTEEYSIGDRIADERLSVIDDINSINSKLIGLNKIDDEGEDIQKITLVKNGVLNSFLCDSELANFYNLNSRSCARRQSFFDCNLPRMRATYISPSVSKENVSIYQNANRVVLLNNVIAGNVNPIDGSFMLIGNGNFIRNEKVIGKLNKIVISGKIIDTINSIEQIGSDFKSKRISCNKYGQSISVGVGSPTIKFGKIMISGE